MIRFTSLTIKNFLSYGAVPTVIPLDRPGTTLILGEDLDNSSGGTGANGVGKTVIINALAYGVYDKPISNISKDNLINNINKAHMEVIVEFYKGQDKFVIRRVRAEKKGATGNYVHLFKNDQDITPDSATNTNKTIEEIIGLPYELFVRIVVFSATHQPFLDLPVRHATGPNQTDIIEELFDLKTLTERANTLKEHAKDLDLKIKSMRERHALLEDEHERHSGQLESARRRVNEWEENHIQEIANLARKLQKFADIDVAEERELWDKLQSSTTQRDELESRIKTHEKDLKRAEREAKTAREELAHLADDECPACHQPIADAKQKIEETQKLLSEAETDAGEHEKQLSTLEQESAEHTAAIKTISEQLKLKTLKELEEAETKTSEYERRIEEMDAQENPHMDALQELEGVQLEEINSDELDDLIKRQDHMKFLLKLLTKKDSFVRRTMLDKNLPFLNERLSHYLTNLGLSHQVEFTQEMTASITQFGRVLDFGNLSNGQRARVNIALSFAFRDVLQSLHQRINICMLDEVLDVGLDEIGVKAAARMLKRKARDESLSLYVITHRGEIDSAFDHRMTIQMKDGFSQVLDEACE